MNKENSMNTNDKEEALHELEKRQSAAHNVDSDRMPPAVGEVLESARWRNALIGLCDTDRIDTPEQAVANVKSRMRRMGIADQAQQPVSGADGLLAAICDAFHIGSAVRTPETVMANIENAIRRSRCLSAVEQHLTLETPPDPDEGDDEPGEECLLRWGAEPDIYAEHFAAALTQFLAAQHQPSGTDNLPRYIIYTRPGMVPERKGPYPTAALVESALRELQAAHPDATSMVIHLPADCYPQSGVEWIDMHGDKSKGRLLPAQAGGKDDTDPTPNDQYRSMYRSACADLAAINEALGLDPDDGGADPIIDAIEQLRAPGCHESLSEETLRVAGVIADKIEDGSLFRAGIYSNAELAEAVRKVQRAASTALARDQVHIDVARKAKGAA